MLGILCGLQSEAKIADRIPHVLVACSEGNGLRAAEMARFLVRQGATRLVSFGLAGALAPDMRAGDLLLGATVLCARGGWEADDAWNMLLMNELADYQCVPFYGAERIFATPQIKRACLAKTGCMAVDMESHVLARVAARAKVPFNIVRAVADTATMALPPAALVPLGPDGRVDLKGVFASVKKEPAQIPELLRLARFSYAAHRALRLAVRAMTRVEAR